MKTGAGVHDLVSYLIDHAPSAVVASGSSGSSDTVKVAIVTAIGVVLAAAITAIASTFQREKSAKSTVPASDTLTRDYVRGLVQDQKELRKLQIRYAHLREACLERHLDPDELIREQENA